MAWPVRVSFSDHDSPGAGVSARYNPRTGTYSRGAAAYGPYGSRAAGQAYNPRTGAYGQTRQGSNVYGSWGSTQVQRGDQWASTNRYTSNATGATTRTTRTSSGAAAATRSGAFGSTTVGRTAGGDVYAGRDGNVYRNQGGSWQQYDSKGNWSNTTPRTTTRSATPATSDFNGPPARAGSGTYGGGTYDQLNRDSQYRREGTQNCPQCKTRYKRLKGTS